MKSLIVIFVSSFFLLSNLYSQTFDKSLLYGNWQLINGKIIWYFTFDSAHVKEQCFPIDSIKFSYKYPSINRLYTISNRDKEFFKNNFFKS